MSVNLRGTYFFCRKAAEYLTENNIRGNILLVLSSRGSEPAFSSYEVFKWGIKGLTEGLAKMLIKDGIVVNSIALGSTAISLIGYKDGYSIFVENNDFKRLIMTDEVADIVKTMVSSSGRTLTGEIIHVSAGKGVFDIR